MQQRFDVSQMIDDFCSKPISSASGSDSEDEGETREDETDE